METNSSTRNWDLMKSNQLLKGKDVAHILNVSQSFAYQLMRREEIQTVRMGRSVRVRPEDLDAYIAAQCNGGGSNV